MDESQIRQLIGEVNAGRLSRRRFVRSMVTLGLTVPLASASSPPSPRSHRAPGRRSSRRGGAGAARSGSCTGKAPTLLNPHLAVGVKDATGSRIFYEPLADFDAEGQLVPVLAAEIPSAQNGGISRDGTAVTWTIKKGVSWHDGTPLTAGDVGLHLGIRGRPRHGRDDARDLSRSRAR
jgi:peptide/nickel transport system substrate-binding protein